MITLEKVKLIIEKKNDNPDQLNLFGDNGDKKNKKSKAQQYTDKINRQNKNRPEGKRSKRVFPGDKSGAYQAAKSDLEAREALKKAGASGDVSKTAGPEIRKKVETKRQARVKSLRLPDTSFGAKLSKKPIRPFGKVGRDKAPEGLFGAGDTKGQMTTKRMDTKAFKKTQPTSDLLPKSFKDFDKKLKSLKVDVDIEKRIENPKTASRINKSKPVTPSGNPDLTARRVMGAAGSDSNFTSAEPVPKSSSTVKPFKPSKTFIDKVRKRRAARKTIKDLNKEMGANELIKRITAKSKESPKINFDGQQNIFNDPNFDKKTKNNKSYQRKSTSSTSGSGQNKSFKQLQFDMNQSRKSILKTGSGERIRAPRVFKQGSVKNPEIVTSTPFDKKNTSLIPDNINVSRTQFKQELDKLQQGVGTKVQDMMKKAKDASKQNVPNVSYDPQVARQAKTLGRYKRFKSYMKGRGPLRKALTFATKNPGKAGLIGAGLVGAGALAYNAFKKKPLNPYSTKDFKRNEIKTAGGLSLTDIKNPTPLDKELMNSTSRKFSKAAIDQMGKGGRYDTPSGNYLYNYIKTNKDYRKQVEKTVKDRGYKKQFNPSTGKFKNYSGDPYGILNKKS